jgi:hypothetical protein
MHQYAPVSDPTMSSSPPPMKDAMIEKQRSPWLSVRSKRFWVVIVAALAIIAIALGVGLGVGLNQGGDDNGSSPSGPSAPTNNTNATAGVYWKPKAGDSWQIVLPYALNDTSVNASVYDIDLFLNPASTIAELHAMNRKVICYFSAGSYENFRNDSGEFNKSDYAKGLDGWPGENWLNTNSANVRRIMTERLALAAKIGCDGVDPDNVDGYDNDTGFDLTANDAVNYMTFLAAGAHSLGMAIGLKNAGTIVNATLDMMQWEVNEQCVQYNECEQFQPFIQAGKPVFHIEYPDTAPEVSATVKAKDCGDSAAAGFSTLLKKMNLDNWVETCSS